MSTICDWHQNFAFLLQWNFSEIKMVQLKIMSLVLLILTDLKGIVFRTEAWTRS